MNEAHKAAMREILMARYGMDIAEATMRFSTQNYTFVFDNKPTMLRVSMSAAKSRREILSEMLWVDDLKQFKETVCEPSPSKRGNLMEEFTIDGMTYRAGMFRTARGNVQLSSSIDPMYYICVGDLLGTIHKVSTDERINGIRYERKSMRERFASTKETARSHLPPDIMERIERIESRVNALPTEVGQYGICHCDFHSQNFFVEGNNIWLFDFDSCAYAHYLYDVATFIVDRLMWGWQSEKTDVRRAVYEDILPYLCIGYELTKGVSQSYWDELELFMAYRAAVAAMALTQIERCGVTRDLSAIKTFFHIMLSQDDALAALTRSATALRSPKQTKQSEASHAKANRR